MHQQHMLQLESRRAHQREPLRAAEITRPARGSSLGCSAVTVPGRATSETARRTAAARRGALPSARGLGERRAPDRGRATASASA